MINKAFFDSAVEVAEERGISVEDVYEIFKKGLINSFKKKNGNTSCKVVINPEKHEILLYAVYQVVEEYSEVQDPEGIKEILLVDAKKIKSSYKVGDVIEQQINIKEFSRTEIGATKSVYTQGVKTKQREIAYEHFKSLENEMITAIITNKELITIKDKKNKKEDNNEVAPVEEKKVLQYTLDLGYGVTTRIRENDLLPNDPREIGDKLCVYIKEVENTTKEPKVSVSRVDKSLVTRLMENYIPELKSGIIEIKGLAREPGDRSKIALYSNDPKVDAIGSCVGEGGIRIREIVNALGGEKIDLYKWSDNPEELIANSLQPASVTQVRDINVKEKTSIAIVPDDHLSLAIGKQGLNVRLAVQSCGWKIDIMPVSDAFKEGLLIK